MTEGFRTPALAPPPIRAAVPRHEPPGAWLESHYRRVLAERMHDLPFVHPGLGVEAVGFVRHEGDWLGVMITPWFLNLFLLCGGGTLWGDIPAGQRRYVGLPCGTLQFIADDDPELGPYQYCPLIAPVTALPDMAAARRAAADAVAAVFVPPADAVGAAAPSAPKEAAKTHGESGNPEGADDQPASGAPLSRRGFLRRLAGRK